MLNLPIDQLREHPKQSEFFKPLEGKAWEEFYTDLNARGIQQPVVVSDRTGDWVIADGHQRVRAAKHLGWLEVPCIMGAFENELEEVRCLVMNNARRRQLTREEIDNVIGYWLANYTHHSNRRIADEIGVNHETVEKKRVEMESTGGIRQLDKLEGKDGKVRPRTQPKTIAPKHKHICSVCGEHFPVEVWHCQNCSHHNAAEDDECGNCHLTPVDAEDSAPLYEPDELQARAAELVGLSVGVMQRADVIEEKAAPEIKEAWEQGELSTQEAYRQVMQVAPPSPPPGWQSTETRKELERAATILTRLDSGEGREEIERDRMGTLRPFLQSAYHRLGEMLEVSHDEKLITV